MSKVILCVDDSASMRQAIRLALTDGGYQVAEAVDGKDGLARAISGSFHMIITDLNMPNMDGLTFIREVRQVPAYKGVPIIFLTTESDQEKKAAAKSAGATGWITKPFNPDQLLGVTKKVLG